MQTYKLGDGGGRGHLDEVNVVEADVVRELGGARHGTG
jgi:hypothetical protein